MEVFLLATGLVLLAMRLLTTEPTMWSGPAAGETLALALVTAVAYALWDVAMRRGNVRLVLAASYFTPLLSTLVSCLYLNLAPGPKLWMGCLVLVAGSLLSWVSVSDRPQASPRRLFGS